MQPTTTPPKKYVQGKDGSNKLVLNPEYKTWMKEKLYYEETNSRTDTTPTVLSMSTTTDPVAISYEPDETDIPTAVAASSCEDIPMITAVHVYDDDDVQSYLSEPSMMTETSEQEQRIEMLRSENQRLLEIANLRTERDRLEEANRASEDVRRLQEENERLKKEKKRLKKSSAAAAAAGTKMYESTIPRGIQPGQSFNVTIQGKLYSVKCPPNGRPGQTIQVPIKLPPVTAPKSDGTKLFAATIPKGVRPGQAFKISVQGQQFSVTCPRNTRPGQTIHVPIKLVPQNNKTQPTMYAVKVPKGTRPGKKFKVSVQGKSYTVKCPSGVRPGQTIHVPIR